MLTLSNHLLPWRETLTFRAKIFIFLYFTTEFMRAFVTVGMVAHPLMAVWCSIFFDATVIIILHLLFCPSSIGRDINTLSFYGMLVHLAYMFCYYKGIEVSTYHNNLLKAINALIVLRLFLPAHRDFFSRIAAIEYAKKWLYTNQKFTNQYINGLTISLFFICALPMFVLIYLINTDQMRITGIAIVLVTFYTAFEKSSGNSKNIAVAEPATKTLDEKKIERTELATDLAEKLSIANKEVRFLQYVWKILCGGIVVFGLVGLLQFKFEINKMFDFGYAFGYADGKKGAPPKAETSLEKLHYCYHVFDPMRNLPDPGVTGECDVIDSNWRPDANKK